MQDCAVMEFAMLDKKAAQLVSWIAEAADTSLAREIQHALVMELATKEFALVISAGMVPPAASTVLY